MFFILLNSGRFFTARDAGFAVLPATLGSASLVAVLIWSTLFYIVGKELFSIDFFSLNISFASSLAYLNLFKSGLTTDLTLMKEHLLGLSVWFALWAMNMQSVDMAYWRSVSDGILSSHFNLCASTQSEALSRSSYDGFELLLLFDSGALFPRLWDLKAWRDLFRRPGDVMMSNVFSCILIYYN